MFTLPAIPTDAINSSDACSVCLERMPNVMLPCCHCFCHVCLMTSLEAGDHRCALCRAASTTTEVLATRLKCRDVCDALTHREDQIAALVASRARGTNPCPSSAPAQAPMEYVFVGEALHGVLRPRGFVGSDMMPFPTRPTLSHGQIGVEGQTRLRSMPYADDERPSRMTIGRLSEVAQEFRGSYNDTDLGERKYAFIPEKEVMDENVARVVAKLREMGVASAPTFAQVRQACLRLRIHEGVPTYYSKICGVDAPTAETASKWLEEYAQQVHFGKVSLPPSPGLKCLAKFKL